MSNLHVSVLVGVFLAACVEVIEMTIIVVGVGTTRGWRSTLIGAASGLVVLAGIVAGLGQALALIPIDLARVVIGGLLLTFAFQWLYDGVVGVAAAGFSGPEEEEEDAAGAAGESADGVMDWTAWLLAFKGVLLEGLEVAFIVVAFGTSGGRSTSEASAYIGAAAAFVVIGTTGAFARTWLENIPGRSLKFGVSGLLATFGTFWTLEGVGASWPGQDASLAWLYTLYLVSTYGLVRASRAGLIGPRPLDRTPDFGVSGPMGVAPASESSIGTFQQANRLSVTGVVDAQTQAALRAVRVERDLPAVDEHVVGVDAADPASVRALQRRSDLPETGEIDAPTRGAVRVAQIPGLVDPLDAAAVTAFQDEHALEPTGRVDGATRSALRAVGVTAEPSFSSEKAREWHEVVRDPLRQYRAFDAAAPDTVRRFQLSIGLPGSGDVDAETRGALRALRAIAVVDVLDEHVVERIQAEERLPTTGIVDDATRHAARTRRRQALDRLHASATDPDRSLPDVADQDSVRGFQRRHGLEESGIVDESTRQAMRWVREGLAEVDPASAESVKEFQRAHDLEPTGMIDPDTQAAISAVRHVCTPTDDDERQRRYGRFAHGSPESVDPADPESIRTFQRTHGLVVDGIIGPSTQAALRALRARPSLQDDTRTSA